MAANQYGIDLGEIYRTTEAVKSARAQNKMAEMKMGEYEKAQERKNLLTGLRQKAATGNQDATKQLLAIDPDGGSKFIDAVSKMDDRQIEATKRTVDEIGQLSAYVLNGKTPEEQQRRFNVMKSGVSEEAKAKLPESYDQQFMEMSLTKATAMDKILENPKVVQFGGEDIAYKGGIEVGRTKHEYKPTKGTGSGAGGADLKSADESLMYRQAGELLGGVFDQQGNITNLDPDTRNKVQAIATEAVKLYRQQGNISRTEAVELAGKKFGLNIPSASGQNNDPLGIR